jgi:uncharacterized membrane protein
MKNRFILLAWCIFVGAIFYGAIPFFGRNYIPTHDGEYHIIRIVEFARMLGAGYIFPRWAPDMNSGYGIPIFNYHYPLPNYIGSLVRVFTRDAVYAFQVSMGLGYIVLAAGAYVWLSALFGTFAGLVGATVAAFVPYVFVDMYIRGSIGEVWATAFLLFALYFIEKKRHIWFAVFYGLIIVSHNILAMLYTPFIFGYATLQDKKALLWMLGGLGMSAFFWLPAIVESKYVVGLNTINFRNYFVDFADLLIPSWGSGFAGSGGTPMSVQIGIVPLLITAFAFAREKKYSSLFWFFSSVLALCIFLMLPVSAPIWNIVTPLAFTQYPWRLLSFIVPIVGFFAAGITASFKTKWVGLILVVIAVLAAAGYRPVLYEPRNEAYYMSRSNFVGGTSSMGNSFSTIWTGWKDTPATRSATLYFPGWKAYVNGKEVPITNNNGVIEVTSSATLTFTETPIRLAADIISIGTLGVLLILLFV